jgi:LuxR family maltose regulon positive regulatory protein
MCAPLCDAVLETGDWRLEIGDQSLTSNLQSQQILDFLDHSNLFIVPLDNQREWYRYHRLFGDLLRYRLQASYPHRLPDLHRRAAAWFAGSGDPDEAVRHAFAASDFDLAARLVEGYMLQFLGDSRVATCLSWVQAIPHEVIVRRAYLCAGCGWVYAILSQAETARKYVEAGEAALSFYEASVSLPEGRRISAEEVRGHLAAIRAYTDRLLGEFQAAIVHSEAALGELPAEASSVRSVVAFNLGLLYLQNGDLEMAPRSFREAFESAQRSAGNLYIAVSALSLLGNVAALQGKLGEAGHYYRRAVEIGTVGPGRTVPLPALCYAYGGLVALHYQRDEITLAGEYLDKAYPLAVQIGQEETTTIAMIYYALLAQARGEFDLAGEWLDKAAGLLEAHPQREGILAEYLAARVGLLLAHGDASEAARLLAQYGVRLDGPGVPLEGQPPEGSRLAEFLLLACVLLAQDALPTAVDLLKRVAVAAQAAGNTPALIEALVFQSVSAGKTREAMPYLERALSLGAAEGYVRPFLNAGASLVKLLRQAIVEDFQPGYTHRLLTALEGQMRRVAAYRSRGTPAGGEEERASAHTLLEPLTDRERQVLRLLAAGLSSTEVAAELVLSTATVRSYMKSLYAKLGAHRRDEAIERGRAVGAI